MQETRGVDVLAPGPWHFDGHDRIGRDYGNPGEGGEQSRLHQVRPGHEEEDDQEKAVCGPRTERNQVNRKGFERSQFLHEPARFPSEDLLFGDRSRSRFYHRMSPPRPRLRYAPDRPTGSNRETLLPGGPTAQAPGT